MLIKKWLLPVSLLCGLVLVLFVSFGNQNTILEITKEDGLLEDLTAIFYLLGFVFGLISIFKGQKKIFFPVLWTILCFVFLGEETSWFQRIFDYSVPAVEAVSYQSEFNLHNLDMFKGESLVDDGEIRDIGIFDFLRTPQNIFRLGFFGYFLILPILMVNKKIETLLLKIGYIKPSLKFILTFLAILLLSFVLSVLSPEDVKRATTETREMFYAYFIFIYIIIYFWQGNKYNSSIM